MDIKIKAWKAEGLRGAMQDFQIDLSDPLRPIALIQMPTGTGKTTTMTLLRKAFSGDPFSRDEVEELRAEIGPEEGLFELELGLDQTDCKIKITFDFVDLSARYNTVLTPGGNRQGHALPRPYDRLLDKNLARLFVFDGELAAELRDRHLTSADEAIDSLYRLSVLSGLKADADTVLETQRKQNKHITGQQSNTVQRRKDALIEAEDRLQELVEERRVTSLSEASLAEELNTLQATINDLAEKNSKIDDAYEVAKGDVATAAARLDAAHAQVSSYFPRPQALHPAIGVRLAHCYDQIEAAKLPGPSSKVWFDWLSKQPECVCGRPLTDQRHRETILENKDQYLGDEQHGLVNQIKGALKQGAVATAMATETIEALDEATSEHQHAKQQLRAAQDRRIKAAGGNIDTLRSQEKKIENDLNDAQKILATLDASDGGSWKDSIPLCQKEVDSRKEALNEASDTFKTYQKVKFLQAILDEVAAKTVEKVRTTIQDRTNEKLAGVIHAERLTIDRIDRALQLSGTSRVRGEVSVGQSLAVAYAFLTSLFEHASYRLPFIVDSPAGPIDVETRKSVSKLLPQMFPQLIMFVQSGEREGFVEAFYERNDVQYLTCWREPSGIRTECGREAFEAFHSDDDAKPKGDAT